MEQMSTASVGPELLVAIELSKKTWLVACHDPSTGKISRHGVAGGDAAALTTLLGRLADVVIRRLGSAVSVTCVYEAGYDGFWLQRELGAADIGCLVMDPASLKVDRRARRVKTDRIDAESLLRALLSWRRGDRQACRFVRVPSVAEEDARRPHRELDRLRRERVAHVNRIKGLLALHGTRDYQPLRRDRRERLETLATANGQLLPPRLRQELGRELDRLELVLDQIASLSTELQEASADAGAPATAQAIQRLEQLTCIGQETATVLAREVLCRDFRDRRSLAAFTGLTPSPYSSGKLHHEQGISKAGNSLVRARLIQLAWRWVRFQTDSQISRWFVARTAQAGPRQRRIAIVAVARKLIVALWRYSESGLVPEGARLKLAATPAAS